MMKPTIQSKKKIKAQRAPMKAPQKVTKLDKAREAVKVFEAELRILRQMEADWKQKYTKANQELQTIKEQTDLVVDLIVKAKPLVAAAKESVGDFRCSRKYSAPAYNEGKVTELISETENPEEIIAELLSEGVIKTLVLDQTLSVPWIAKRPEYSEFFKDAWVDRTEMTPSVTVPKV